MGWGGARKPARAVMGGWAMGVGCCLLRPMVVDAAYLPDLKPEDKKIGKKIGVWRFSNLRKKKIAALLVLRQ